MIKPFLLLQSRPEDPASDDEYRSFHTFGELEPAELVRVRMDKGDLPDINLDDFSGVIVGGGPACVSSDEEQKSDAQKAFEPWLFDLVRRIVDEDKPYLGACLGLGVLVKVMDGEVSWDFHEDVGPADIVLSDAAKDDELMQDFPEVFAAFVGHKEGTGEVPDGAVELARSSACVQMLRVGRNVYATQFHPELDQASLALRIEIYKNAGYFPPHEADALIAMAWESNVTEPDRVIKQFVARYKQEIL
jgi:GMP synthase (glutamine-hydrolysing)